MLITMDKQLLKELKSVLQAEYTLLNSYGALTDMLLDKSDFDSESIVANITVRQAGYIEKLEPAVGLNSIATTFVITAGTKETESFINNVLLFNKNIMNVYKKLLDRVIDINLSKDIKKIVDNKETDILNLDKMVKKRKDSIEISPIVIEKMAAASASPTDEQLITMYLALLETENSPKNAVIKLISDVVSKYNLTGEKLDAVILRIRSIKKINDDLSSDILRKVPVREGNAEFKIESFIQHIKEHVNSKGENAPWVIKDHKNKKILKSFKSEAEAKKALQNMHIFGELDIDTLIYIKKSLKSSLYAKINKETR